MSKLVQTDMPGFYRDMNTGAVLNRNYSELNQYMTERKRYIEQDQINKRINELETAVFEIKEILKMVVEKRNGN